MTKHSTPKTEPGKQGYQSSMKELSWNESIMKFNCEIYRYMKIKFPGVEFSMRKAIIGSEDLFLIVSYSGAEINALALIQET